MSSFSQRTLVEEPLLPPYNPAVEHGVDDEISSLALHTEALTAQEVETGQSEEHLSDISSSSIILDKLKVEVPSEEVIASLDRKSLDSDQSAVSLEHSFVLSDSSSDAKQDMRRKDSFYESDDDEKVPKKVSPRKALSKFVNIDIDKPPAYESAISQTEAVVVSDRPLRAPAIVKPPRAGKPKKDQKIANVSPASETGFSVFVMGKPSVSEQHQFAEPVAKEVNHLGTHTAQKDTSTVQLTSYGVAVAENISAEVSTDEDAPAPPLRGRSTEPPVNDLLADLPQHDFLARLDSTENDSYQVFTQQLFHNLTHSILGRSQCIHQFVSPWLKVC